MQLSAILNCVTAHDNIDDSLFVSDTKRTNVVAIVVFTMYRASSLRALAIVQMVIGDIMLILGVSGIFAVQDWSSEAAFGVWIGVWVCRNYSI